MSIANGLELQRQEDGNLLIIWTANARKLDTKDQQMKSPDFYVAIAGQQQPFRLCLFPNIQDAKQQKGALGFKKAKGKARAELKCEAALSEKVPKINVQFGIGDPTSNNRSDWVAHNFGQQFTCGFPGVWELKSAVNAQNKNAFTVYVLVSQDSS